MPIPLSLYIHIPWCIQKCPYCDFNSHAVKTDNLPEQAYINQLLADLAADVARFGESRPLTSIFIGGGTPSLFSGNGIGQLLDGIAKQLNITADTEITLEANPGTVDEQHFRDYYQLGVNRLSVGIQSFNKQQLKRLGRIHNPADALRAVKIAQDSGFDNINIDLMFGLPQQTTQQAIDDIDQGITLNTPHLSYYQLTLEPNTAFAHNPPKLPDEESIDKRFELAAKQLLAANFSRYEVSAWTRGLQSQHNLNYWQYGDYLGIGAGAHGKITLTEDNKKHIIRTTKPRSPKQYLAASTEQSPLAGNTKQLRQERQVNEDEKAFEFMLNALRLMNGFEQDWITSRGLVSLTAITPTINQLKEKGLLTEHQQTIMPTELGKRFVNDMVQAFLPNH